MPDIAEIFKRYGSQYLDMYAEKMLPSHKRALYDITYCRSGAFGFHLDSCDTCGYTHLFFHSCCNRNCPKCHSNHTKKWLEDKEKLLLPTTYFHLVFTLPEELRLLVRANQNVLLNCLIKAAAYALQKLMADEDFANGIGGIPGMLCVLHTWTRTMIYHPHVHFLVAGGVVSKDLSQWLPLKNKKFLVPLPALSDIFRARFLKLARKEIPRIELPISIWKKKWVVFAKPYIKGGQKVLNYLARYIHRIAITNNRIVEHKNGAVTFQYFDLKSRCKKTLTLPALEFIRRFLQHVLPKGFHKVRYYGFLAPTYRDVLHSLKVTFALTLPNKITTQKLINYHRKCPRCKTGNMIVKIHIFYKKHVILFVRPPP
jgi:hypothetical protein